MALYAPAAVSIGSRRAHSGLLPAQPAVRSETGLASDLNLFLNGVRYESKLALTPAGPGQQLQGGHGQVIVREIRQAKARGIEQTALLTVNVDGREVAVKTAQEEPPQDVVSEALQQLPSETSLTARAGDPGSGLSFEQNDPDASGGPPKLVIGSSNTTEPQNYIADSVEVVSSWVSAVTAEVLQATAEAAIGAVQASASFVSEVVQQVQAQSPPAPEEEWYNSLAFADFEDAYG